MINHEILTSIAREYGTPTYVFDIDELTERINKIKNILGDDVILCYAMKANPFLVDAMRPCIEKYEVCSPGEFAICEREGIEMNRIVLSGVNKELEDIVHVMDECGGVGIYTVESMSQFIMLNECASERKTRIQVLLRITSGNQFGLDESDIEHIISQRDQYEFIDFKGIQCYSGTQKKKISIIEKELDWLDSFCDKLKEKYGFVVRELEYGPGLPISYFQPDIENNNFEMLQEFSEKLKSIKQKYEITLEIGRFIAATCGIFLTRIADMKTNNNQKYCIVDGGINHLNYYGQTMAMKIPQFDFVQMNQTDKADLSSQENVEHWNVCGSLCTVADVIVKNMPLNNAKIGDMIIFYNVGAYSVTEGIYLFLSRKLPKVVTYDSNHKATLIREGLPTDIINSRMSNI